MINRLFKLIEHITPSRWHWILQHEGHKRYFANMSWMFGGQMFSLLVSFFIGAWIARYLGPENYGVLSYSIAFVGLFGFIASLGIDSILNRELIQTRDKRDELLGTAFRLKLIGGVIAFSLAFISVLLFQSSPLVQLLVVLFSFSFILQSINVISIYFNAEVKSKNNVRTTIIATIISSILKIIVILLGEGVIWLIIIYVLDSLWQGIGLVRAYKHYGLKIRNWKFDNVLAKEMLKNSWPLILASATGYIYLKIDQVMIGQMLGNYEVGIYAAAVKLVEIWYFIPGIICTSLFPAIINAKKTSVEMYRNRLRNFYILMTLIPIAMAIPITLLAKPIILILFGSGYIESIVILQIYIWSSIGLFLNYATGQYLMSENLVKIIFWLSLLGMIVNIVLNLILIPIFGIVGSAWATLISYLTIPIFIIISGKIWKRI
ncbi:MAG: flippase [Candidatus Paceibacterota bacterium]